MSWDWSWSQIQSQALCNLQHLLCLIIGELALVDEGCDSGVKGMDAFIG